MPLTGCFGGDDTSDSTEDDMELLLTDSDSDGVPDSVDNCPDLFNPDQFSGLPGYECDEDELRSQINQPVVMPRSGGGNQVTDLQISPSSYTYTLQDTIEASFTGTWFWYQDHLWDYRPPNVDVAIDLEDSQGNVVYQNVISFSGNSVSLDSHSPNDPSIGMRIWEETGPSHPLFGGTNGLDFSATTLGAGIFCWVGSITAHINIAGQYHSSGSYYTQTEHANANECFEIENRYSYFNPTGNGTSHVVSDCEPGAENRVKDIHLTQSSKNTIQGRMKAAESDFYSDPWNPIIDAEESMTTSHVPPTNIPGWASSVSNTNAEWIWINLSSEATLGSNYFTPNAAGEQSNREIDVKMSFDVPAGATEVVARFSGHVDNQFIAPSHPNFAFTVLNAAPVAIIQDRTSSVFTSWEMDQVLHNPPHHSWTIGQQHTQALPDSLGTTDGNYDLILSAKDWDDSGWGVSFSLEVTYCTPMVEITNEGGDTNTNHPPHIDAEVFFTDPAMLNYAFDEGNTADQYDYSAFISWDTWDIDGIVETVEVDYDRDGVADIMLPEVESPYYHLIYPYHNGVEFERAILNNQCFILSFRMIDLIATDNDGDSVTYTIRTGTDEVNDWDSPENDQPATTRRDAQWLMDIHLIQDTQYVDWIYGVGNNECPSPIELEFSENSDPLTDTALIGTLNIMSMGDESYPSNHMMGGTITATDPATGNTVTNSCAVSLVYSNPTSNNLAAGQSWDIFEPDSADGMVCGIDPLDVTSYTWELSISGSSFGLPDMNYIIT